MTLLSESPILADAFEAVSDAPNGIPKLRELILDLAVRGKLVPQNPNDEPASELLKRIAAEKARLVKEKDIRRPKANVPIGNAELPFVVHHGWEWARLGHVIYSMANGIYKPARFYDNTGVQCLRMYNIDGGRINFRDIKRMLLTPEELSTYSLTAGDLLVNRVNSRELVGKAAVVPQLSEPVVFESKNIRVRFMPSSVNSRFVSFLFRTRFARSWFEGDAKQTCGQASVSQPQIAGLPTPIPPLAEQKRIVAKVDALMALCDELETKQNERRTVHLNLHKASLAALTDVEDAAEFADRWAHVADTFDTLITTPEAVTTLRQTILDLAVRGKLVKQDPNDEPASKLLKRIEDEKARLVKEGKIRKPNPLPLVETGEMTFPLPVGWVATRPGSIAVVNPRNDADDEVEAGFVPMKAINDGFWGGHEFERRPWGEVKSGFTHFATGDVVMAKITPCFQNRKSTVIAGLPSGIGAGTTELYVLRPLAESLVPKFALTFLKSHSFISNGLKQMTGTAGQQRVPKDYFSGAPFGLPPLAEQKRIVAKVDALMALCDELDAGLRESSTVSEQLASAVVAQVVSTEEACTRT